MGGGVGRLTFDRMSSSSSHLGRGPFVLVMPVLLYYLFRVLLPDSEGPKPLDAPPVTGHIVAERRDGLQIFFPSELGVRCVLVHYTRLHAHEGEMKK